MIYSSQEIETLREGGRKLAEVLREVVAAVKPGVTTEALNRLAEERIRQAGGEPSFLHYQGGFGAIPFPGTLCTSLNNEVVHGVPIPARTLKEGDIIGLDIGMRWPAQDGLCTDMAVTVAVGDIPKEAQRLINVTHEALDRGIGAAQAGAKMRDIGAAVQRYVEGEGFSIVRDLIGHGVGKQVHEDPEVPNFVVRGPIGDYVLKPGLVIAIEPMVNAGRPEVETLDDQWTVATRDKSLAAHFEHTVVITDNGADILTI